jgi:peptide/nickel transport system substrate-binding protein
VEWLYIPDAATANGALEKGEVDYWEFPPNDFVPVLEKNPDITIFVGDPFGAQAWLRPNHLHPPFNNKKARQALLWMVKQETYLQAAYGDKRFWKTCPAFLMCGSPYASTAGSEAVMEQDFEKAKQLLKEAGYDGRPIVLMDATDISTNHNAALVTQQLLTKIGMKVELQAMDWSTVVARRAEKKPVEEGGWNLFHTGWIFADLFTPAVNQGIRGGCENNAWFGWYCSEKMEQLRTAWAKSTDDAERKKIAEEIQKVAMDEVPYIPLGENTTYRAHRNHVKGILQFPAPVLWNVWLDK